MKTNICVYTREADPATYPEGLARSVHFACVTGEGQKKPFNKDYGILWARGRVSDKNTIVPVGVKDPKIFEMQDGTIGICAEQVLENGTVDETLKGKAVLWKTKDLICFSEQETVDLSELEGYTLSDTLSVDLELAERAFIRWSPVLFTGISLPEDIEVSSEDELDAVRARLLYTDGSERPKKVCWDGSGIDFERPGVYTVRGRIRQQRFRFPLADGYGDPVIFSWEGKWYYISTNDNLNDIGIYAREASDVHGLFEEGVKEHLILPFDPARGLEQTFWAPEFHVIGGELYILFAVSGHMWGPQCHMMKFKKGGSIIDADSWEDPVRVVRADGSPLAKNGITLDMTFIRAESGSYVIWSYREYIGTPLDTGSMLYIASVSESEPWKLTSEPVLLTRPLYGWENVLGTINNEGPYAFVKDGRVYVTYSGGSANAFTYALGLLTADTHADLTDISSWTKSITPVLTFYSVDGEYGPGHNSFYTNEEGEFMIAYHGETAIDGRLRCDGIRRVHFRSDGTPYFGMSWDDDVKDTEVEIRVTVPKHR